MKIEFWERGQSLGHFSAEQMQEMCGDIDGPVVAVIDEQGGCAIMQPIDPQTGNAWESEADALAFAERYLAPPPPSEEETAPEEE